MELRLFSYLNIVIAEHKSYKQCDWQDVNTNKMSIKYVISKALCLCKVLTQLSIPPSVHLTDSALLCEHLC